MTTRITIRNHGKDDKVIIVEEKGVKFSHEIEAGCERDFDVHKGNSFTVNEKQPEDKK